MMPQKGESSSYLSGMLKGHHHVTTRESSEPTPEDGFLHSVMVRRSTESDHDDLDSETDEEEGLGSAEEYLARMRPSFVKYCGVAKRNRNTCSCKALVCKPTGGKSSVVNNDGGGERNCVYTSLQMKMSLSCTLKKTPSQIENFDGMSKEDCECQFSRL